MALSGVFGNVFGDGDHAAVADVRLATVYNNGGLTGTLDPGGSADYPATSDVRDGVSFDSGGQVGSLAVPPPGKVIAPTPTDATVGTYVEIVQNDARLNVQYGAAGTEFTGNITVPIVTDVRKDVQFGSQLSQTGLLVTPSPNDTRFGIPVEATTGLCRVPSTQDVQTGVLVDVSGSGSFESPAATNVRDSIGYGHNNEFVGTLDVNADANLPAAADVLNGVLYGEGNSNTGTYVTPDNDYVVNPTAYGPSSSIMGNYFIAAVPIVKLGEIYGPNNTLTGAYDPAAPDPDHALQRDVREGVVYSNGTLTGIMVEVAEVDVREGTVYDSITSQKTGSLIVPSVDDVRLSIAVDNTVGTVRVPAEQYVALGYQYDANDSKTGTLDTTGGGTLPIYPVQDDVRNGIQYGDTGLLQYTGNYEPAVPSDVRLGQEYGAQGIEYVGTFDCGTLPGSDVGWIG